MYHLISAAILGALSIVWSRGSVPDVLLKVALCGLAIWGVWEFLTMSGYVIRVPQ